MNKIYFAYIRVSTVKQGEHGVSLQEQKDAIQNYARKHNLEISSWYEEMETAAKRGRPAFTQMMKLLKQGKADGVIIHKIDRSARNLKDWADLGELIDQGIEVHFVHESLDLNSRSGRLSADILAIVAADTIRNMREEIKKGFNGRLKQGLYPWPAPVGYLDRGGGVAKEPDPAKAPLIRKVFELYATGRYNLDTLTEEIYSLGLRNRNGKRVTINGLSKILNNPFYIGLIRLKSTGETFPGSHKPLITKSLFDRVKNILNGKTNTRSIQHDFLFRRLIVCKQCGYSLIGETHKGYIYYRCQAKHDSPVCVREEILEEKIKEILSLIHFSNREMGYMKNKVTRLKEDWEEKKENQINAISLNINSLQDRLGRLTDAYIDRVIEKDLFEDRKTSLLMEKKTLEEKLSEIQDNGKTVPDQISEFLELAKNAYLSYKMGMLEEKRDLLKIITSNRSVEGKNVSVELKNPFSLMADGCKFSNGGAYRDKPRTVLDRLLKKLYQYFTAQYQNGQETGEFSFQKPLNKKAS